MSAPRGTVERHELGQLLAELERTAGMLHVQLSGRSVSRDGLLARFLDHLLEVARVERRVLALHFERLAYFDSSTLAALVRVIREAHAAGVGLNVVYDPRQRWQAVSFDALRRALPAEGEAGTAVHFSEA
jgi:ABC-type transporter Mla MlaB component